MSHHLPPRNVAPALPLPAWAAELRPCHFIPVSSLCWLLHGARASLGHGFPTPTLAGFEACVFLLFAFSKRRVLFLPSQPADHLLLPQRAALIPAMLPQAPGHGPRVYFSWEWGGERSLHETPLGFWLKSWWFWFRSSGVVSGDRCAQQWLHWVSRPC